MRKRNGIPHGSTPTWGYGMRYVVELTNERAWTHNNATRKAMEEGAPPAPDESTTSRPRSPLPLALPLASPHALPSHRPPCRPAPPAPRSLRIPSQKKRTPLYSGAYVSWSVLNRGISCSACTQNAQRSSVSSSR